MPGGAAKIRQGDLWSGAAYSRHQDHGHFNIDAGDIQFAICGFEGSCPSGTYLYFATSSATAGALSHVLSLARTVESV